MSLTEATQAAPWPPYPELPDDVLAEINYVSVQQTTLGVDLLELRLRGGERLTMPRVTPAREIIGAVRKAAMMREQAALEAVADVSTPLGAELALSLLDMAATRQVGCKCCGSYAEGGCVLPPGADPNDPNYRCEYVNADGEQCQCWGGPDRECEDCWLSSK